MLFELYVKNYALIDELTIQFDEGFNVITGETGVGKSILIDALTMCLGMRANKDAIRKGQKKLITRAVFLLNKLNPKLVDQMEKLGFVDDINTIILSREVYESGKSIGRINGQVVTINDLKETGMLLVDIHSQREHQSLLDKKNHLDILDQFIGDKHVKELEELNNIVIKFNELNIKRTKLLNQEQQVEREKDILEYQLKELNEINITEGEDEQLENHLRILNNAELIFNQSHYAYSKLYSNEKSVYNILSDSIDAISKIVNIDDNLQNTANQLNDALAYIEDAAFYLMDYKEGINFDNQELNDLNQKINKINILKRKYGPEIKDVYKYKEEIEEKLEMISNKDDLLNKLNINILECKNKYIMIAKEISKIRKNAAKEFSQKVTEELKDLAMEKAAFFVNIDVDENRYNRNGMDNVEFYIITNKGDSKKALIKIASGGELSRVILSIKNVINTNDYIDTLIFDEIDTGISGRTAQMVAQKINHIGNSKQVISITHLSQIASMADCHFNVEKESTEKGTRTNFKKLNMNERYIELARLISGKEITDTSIEHAKEMISMNGKIQ